MGRHRVDGTVALDTVPLGRQQQNTEHHMFSLWWLILGTGMVYACMATERHGPWYEALVMWGIAFAVFMAGAGICVVILAIVAAGPWFTPIQVTWPW